jgi:methionine synthase II (cobalamin-independent)
MTFTPNYLTTLIGSVPYTNTAETCQRIAATIDIPIWPQMVKLGFRENMYTQYGAVLPAVVIDDENEKITFDTTEDITPALESFYLPFLEENLDYFGLPSQHAAGFYTMQEQLSETPGDWVKGQVTGPISMGLTVTDQDLRASLYNEMLADALVKNAAMNARWQIRQLKKLRPNVIIFVDEPYMASFGSAFISLSRDQVISMLDEVFEAIHTEGALAGVHCCANTDWSVLLATQVDILNLDAYGYLENLALYPAELRQFLDRGGVIAWGIVPNNAEIGSITPQGLANQLQKGLSLICEKATARGVHITPEEFDNRSLITPACGLGPTTPEIADEVLAVLAETSTILRQKP